MPDEKAMLQLIDERDAAEEALSQAYYLVTGRSPEWSNKFGHTQALEDIKEACAILRQAAKANQRNIAALKALARKPEKKTPTSRWKAR
jgi:hypothetical protein